MPWQADGRRWHTVDRVTTDGKPCRWEGDILDWIDEHIHELGDFGDTDWSDRSRGRDRRAKQSDGWFLHAMTGRSGSCGSSSASAATTSSQADCAAAARHPAAERDARAGSLRQRRAGLGDQPQGALAIGDGAGPSAERDRHAGVPGVPWARRCSRSNDNLQPTAYQAGRRDAVEGQRRALAPGRQGLSAGQEAAVGPGPAAPAARPGARGRARAWRCAGTTATPSPCTCRASAGPGPSGGPRRARVSTAVSWARRANST